MLYSIKTITYFIIGTFYPPGEPRLPHLLRCSGFAVKDHSFIFSVKFYLSSIYYSSFT